ncbi:uncharacterized protein LOC122049429 [Zingiber officinale]|uniref:DUF4408 domain-containing protein n=1 Tax=Zingiber officinale TaxID=94328 RepID=A0A8J5HUE5_ZINOF|nr:uncharacterized protein LOC122049429 [Zingiber officinale]KAG6525409.1 hypothetical protein ZIOFF_015365 [Zingiber officinale]
MADLRPRSPSNGVEKAIWASKILFFLLGILSALRLAVPPAAAALSSALPRLSASLCSCLAPPYLLVVINLIILLIWKLSDQRHHHGESCHVEEKPTEVADIVKIKPSEPPPPSPPAVSLSPDTRPFSWPHIPPSPEPDETPDPDSGDSQLTDSHATDDGDSLDKAAEISDENDSMDATWKAIMEKTPRGRGTLGKAEPPRPSPAPAAIRARLPSATGREEWNQRFDDFIKKRHDQIRLQRHESNQRRLQSQDHELH